MKFQPAQFKGEAVAFDIMADGEVLVEAGKRITSRHVRQLEEKNVTSQVVPMDFVVGKILAKDLIDKESGELVLQANTVLTEEHIVKFIELGVKTFETLYVNELDRGAYIADTLRADESTDQDNARAEIYRMMRPGEPPTKDAADGLFENLFSMKNAMIFPASGG